MRVDLTKELSFGIDVGGTFTDAVLTDGTGVWRAKSPTVPADFGAGVLEACRLAAIHAGSSLDDVLPAVRRFGVGTTAVTNVIASRVGRCVGLITTRGFEDLVPIAKQRQVNDEKWLAPPPRIVERRRIVGVAERIDRDGNVICPLDAAEVVDAARHLIEEEGVEAIVISFLWAFRNSAHEEVALRAVEEKFPDVVAMSAAQLLPVSREYERTTYALMNAYASGAISAIDELADHLRARGLQAPLLLVHSGGGSITTAEARRAPIGLAESGPAAGVAAAAALADAHGCADVLTCDMGGTSFDVAVVSRGQIQRKTRGELMGFWTALPFVDVDSVGAGGGSIGWVDARGVLRVGPRSAGATPGPACYGRGGDQPTVTDALVVLGYIAPDHFLGGDMQLDASRARDVCARLGDAIGLDAAVTAWGIREIALSEMVSAVRARLAARGLDPRAHPLMSYGGCGALFTPDIASAVGSPSALVPELSSVLSALGAATSNVRREIVRSVVGLPPTPEIYNRVVEELTAEAHARLAADGIASEDRTVTIEADMCFRRQSWEIPTRLAGDAIDDASLRDLEDQFRAEYARRYGEGAMMLHLPIDIVALRAVGVGRTPGADLAYHRETIEEYEVLTPSGRRSVRLGRDAGDERDVDVHLGSDLRPGHRITGPALVDHVDTTLWIPPSATAYVDAGRTVRVEVHT